jgi:hypothetical protein
MPGGLLNIKAYGNQNIFIYGNPQKTYWTSTYKRITNFGLQNFRLDYEGLRQINLSSDSIFTFKVKRYSELLTDTMLVVTLPDIYSPILPPSDCTQGSVHGWVPYEFKWIKNIGAQLIKRIRVTVGGALLQEITGTQIIALANRDLSSTSKKKWDIMTGNIPELYDPANAYKRIDSYPNAIYTTNTAGAEPSIRSRQLFIPLPLWWCLNSQQAFPLSSLQYNELHIEVTCRPIQELFQIRDVTDHENNYPVVAPNFNLSQHQFYRFIQTPPNSTLDYENTSTNINMDLHLSSTYCFLDKEEQYVFTLNPQHYLIRELRETLFYDVNTSDKVWLQSTTGMVLNWMLLFQRSDVKTRNEWSNYTNWPYDYLPQDITMLPRLMENSPCYNSYTFNYGINTDNQIIVPNGTLGYGLNPNGNDTGLYSTGDYNSSNTKDILLSLGITFDGTYREEVRPSNIYKYQQQYLSSKGFGYSSLDGLYCYNFCLKTSPFELQPSGCVNLSQFSKIELEFTTIPPIVDPNANYLVICDPETGTQIGVNKPTFHLYEYTYNLYVIEERYNILKFIGGHVGLEYAR